MASPSAEDRELVRQLRAERDRLARHLEEAQAATRRQQETIDRLVAQQENWQVLLRDAQAELRSLHAPSRPARLGTFPEAPPDQAGQPPAENEPATTEETAPVAAEDADQSAPPMEAASIEKQTPATESARVAAADVVPPANAPDSPPVPAEPQAAAVAPEEVEAAAEQGVAMASTGADGKASEAETAAGEPTAAEWPGLAAWAPGSGRGARRARQRRPRR